MKKSRLLSSLLVLSTATTPVIYATSCGCSKSKYEELTAEFKNQAINEFVTIVKIPHVTGRTRKMATYLKEYFKSYIVENSWYEDGYRNADTPEAESSGNICFDVSPSEGCENWPGVTLQGHYDMVGKGTVASGEKGVDAVVDGGIMHSRHYESTLGADDGIGLGIIATIVKNQNKFKHGPLHILLTSDEEADTSGAYTIPTDQYDMVKYDNVINLDAEVQEKITVSCAGTSATTYEFAFEESDYEPIPEKQVYPYTIKVSGLLGGHSANYINEGRLSAIKVLASILKPLNYKNNLNIISFESNNGSSAISNEAEVTFWITDTTKDDLKDYIIDPIWNNYKRTNPIEKDLKIEITETGLLDPKAQGSPANYLTPQGSWKLYTLLNDIPFGPIKWIDKDLKNVSVSNNIGEVHFTTAVTQQQYKLSLKCFSRSCLDDEIDAINQYIASIGKNIFGAEHMSSTEPQTSPIWRYKEKNEMYDLFCKGFNKIKINPTRRDAHSWLECAYFCQKEAHKNARMIAVGPLIKDAHSVNETLYLETLDPLISSLLYTLRHINEL